MRVTLVTGQPRQGKTTLALAVARQDPGPHRLLVLDPVNARVFREAKPPVSGVASWTELATFLVSPHASGDRWELALRSANPADYAAALKYAEHYRHVTLLLDEVLTFASDRDALAWLVKAARTSAHFGGGAGVNLIMTGLAPHEYLEFPSDTATPQRLRGISEVHDESVLARGSGSSGAVGRVPDVPEGQSNSTPPGRVEVAVTQPL